MEDAACKERETQGKESGQGRDWRGKGDTKGEKEGRSRRESPGGEEQREREGVIDGGRKATEKRGHKENERGRRMIGQAERKGRSAGKTEAVYADRRPSAVTARSDERGREEPSVHARISVQKRKTAKEEPGKGTRTRRSGDARPISDSARKLRETRQEVLGTRRVGSHQLRWRPTSSISGHALKCQGSSTNFRGACSAACAS